jgi:hypothetical protein
MHNQLLQNTKKYTCKHPKSPVRRVESRKHGNCSEEKDNLLYVDVCMYICINAWMNFCMYMYLFIIPRHTTNSLSHFAYYIFRDKDSTACLLFVCFKKNIFLL